MRIGGLQKLSLIDYPGRTCAVLFTQGCNFRCPYCHNPELVYPHLFAEPISFEKVRAFLKERRGLLEGVVFSGGEPTLQEDLLEVMQAVRALGYAVKLDTNGSRPDVLAEVLGAADYVAMDIKAPLPVYPRVSGVTVDTYDIARSIFLIQSSGVRHEFRTTFDRSLLSDEDIVRIQDIIGRSRFSLQKHIPFDKRTT